MARLFFKVSEVCGCILRLRKLSNALRRKISLPLSYFGSDVITKLIAVLHKRKGHGASRASTRSLVEALPQFDFVDEVALFLLKEEHFVRGKMEVKNH